MTAFVSKRGGWTDGQKKRVTPGDRGICGSPSLFLHSPLLITAFPFFVSRVDRLFDLQHRLLRSRCVHRSSCACLILLVMRFSGAYVTRAISERGCGSETDMIHRLKATPENTPITAPIRPLIVIELYFMSGFLLQALVPPPAPHVFLDTTLDRPVCYCSVFEVLFQRIGALSAG